MQILYPLVSAFVALIHLVAAQYRDDGRRCGREFGEVSCDEDGPFGGCCSAKGFCGKTAKHCEVEAGCQSGCWGGSEQTDNVFGDMPHTQQMRMSSSDETSLNDEFEDSSPTSDAFEDSSSTSDALEDFPFAPDETEDGVILGRIATTCSGVWQHTMLSRGPAVECQIAPYPPLEFPYVALDTPCRVQMVKTGYPQGNFHLEFVKHGFRETVQPDYSKPLPPPSWYCPPLADPLACVAMNYPHSISKGSLQEGQSFHHGQWVADAALDDDFNWKDKANCLAHTEFNFSWRLIEPEVLKDKA